MLRKFAAAILLVTALAPNIAAAQDLGGYQWKKRVVLAFAPEAGDARLLVQRRQVQDLTARADDRDLVFVAAIGRAGAALRRRYHAPPKGFEVLLIGKDGSVAERSPAPLSASRLAAVVDSMPMRQAEMRHR